MSTPPGVDAPGATQRSGRPAAEGDRGWERRGSSTVSTPPEVDAPGAAQRLGRPVAEEDRRGENQPAWLMGEAAGCRPPPPGNRATSEWCRSRGRGRGAMRCSCCCREGRRWWCRCRNHHCCGFRGCHAVVVGATIIASGRRRPSKVVTQNTSGRWHDRGRLGWQTPRVWK
jgi:hypothetical protein